MSLCLTETPTLCQFLLFFPELLCFFFLLIFVFVFFLFPSVSVYLWQETHNQKQCLCSFLYHQSCFCIFAHFIWWFFFYIQFFNSLFVSVEAWRLQERGRSEACFSFAISIPPVERNEWIIDLEYDASRRFLRETIEHTEHMKHCGPEIPLFSWLSSCRQSLCFFLLRSEAERETLGARFPPGESEWGLLSKSPLLILACDTSGGLEKSPNFKLRHG